MIFFYSDLTSNIGFYYKPLILGLSSAKSWCMGYTAFGRKVRSLPSRGLIFHHENRFATTFDPSTTIIYALWFRPKMNNFDVLTTLNVRNYAKSINQ